MTFAKGENHMRDAFSGYHPVVNFTFFSAVILCSMFFMHPVCLVISLSAGLSYSSYLNGRKAMVLNIRYLLPMLLITAVINPAFNHEGITIILYFHSGNPLTLESVLYGIGAAAMMISVILWFYCYQTVMTSDKFVYLFGRVIPGLSLIFSMVLRFAPRFKAQFKVVSNAQKNMGRAINNKRVMAKARHGIKVLSILITWMLENAIDTADSMKSRGYGLKGRTAFSLYQFDSRDKGAFGVILAFCLYLLAGAFFRGLYFRYFPGLKGAGLSLFTISQMIAYAALCFTPLVINLREDRKWKSLHAKI